MSAIEQIEQLTRVAEGSGYRIRHEYFGGTGGGVCEFGGKKFLFLDLALSSLEQLALLQQVLVEEGVLCESDQSVQSIKRAG
ncbi:MAG: hypothetical protein AAFN77_15145 [Planctomycetota bacterium]